MIRTILRGWRSRRPDEAGAKSAHSISMISGREALSIAKHNAYKRWHGNANVDDPKAASVRFSAGKHGIEIAVDPKFKIDAGQKIFTIGSCFARNVEEALVQRGFDVPTAQLSVGREYYSADVRPNAVLNRYSTHSMLDEIERTLRGKQLPSDGFLDLGHGQYVDPMVALTRPNTLDNCRVVRRLVEQTNALVRECSVVFITLGLTESWYDTATDSVLNSTPPPQLIVRHPERFRFFNAGVTDSVECLERLIDIVWAEVGSHVRFVLTVSPVPLQTTFTRQDVIVANAYSKSALRVAAQIVSSKCDQVDYFPSYEIVTNTIPRFAWCDDRLHVRNVMVEHVIKAFCAAYLR